MAGFAHPRHEEEFGNVLDVVLRAGFGDAQVVADVVVAGRQPQRPFVIENGLADAVLLEVGIGEVIVEFHGAYPAGKNLFVDFGGRMEIAVDIGRVGHVPQLFGRGPGRGLALLRRRLRKAVGRLLRIGCQTPQQQDETN